MQHQNQTDKDDWHIGEVVDVKDPLRAGRIRVCIFGLHSRDPGILPKGDIPWSQIVLPPTGPNYSGRGLSPTGLRPGALVVGRFLDAPYNQQFLVFGTIAAARKRSLKQKKDYNELEELKGESTAEQLFNRIKMYGFSEEYAAGIVAAMVQQVGQDLDPAYRNTALDVKGIGLFTDADIDEIQKYAKDRGINKRWDDLSLQIEFILDCLSGRYAYRNETNGLVEASDDQLVVTVAQIETAQQGGDVFVQNWYRINPEKSKDTRDRFARQIYNAYAFINNDEDIGPFTPRSDPRQYELGTILDTEEELEEYIDSRVSPLDIMVTHHADVWEDQKCDAFEINRWHIERGFSEIGYHFVILRNGQLQIGRDINKVGAHALPRDPYNTRGIGVCLVGGREGTGPNDPGASRDSNGRWKRSSDTFTPLQWDTYNRLIKAVNLVRPGCVFLGHRDVDPSNRSDPEFDVRLYVQNLLNLEE